MRALAPAPDDRYPTAQALQVELEAFARAEGLVLSTVALGEFMHTLFAHRIAEWQRAQQSGKSLKQHLAEVEAASARLEASSQPTATDLNALVAERRPPPRRAPAIAAAVLLLARCRRRDRGAAVRGGRAARCERARARTSAR